MRRFISLLLVFFLSFGLMTSDAQAKRFGGGRSFGMQRSMGSFSRMQQPPQMPFSRPAPTANKWLGPLAGFVAGGLLASLFMGHGLMSGMMSWFALACIAFFVIQFIRNRMQPAAQSTSYSRGYTDNIVRDTSSYFPSHQASAPFNQPGNYPLGFNAETFLREAKVQFIRLQAAYDQKNLNDLRQFTSPQVFGEIQLQLQERGNEPNQTEVVTLEAVLLEAVMEPQSFMSGSTQYMTASVQFSGSIREEAHPAAPFSEIWHFRKEMNSQQWLVDGIQQEA